MDANKMTPHELRELANQKEYESNKPIKKGRLKHNLFYFNPEKVFKIAGMSKSVAPIYDAAMLDCKDAYYIKDDDINGNF